MISKRTTEKTQKHKNAVETIFKFKVNGKLWEIQGKKKRREDEGVRGKGENQEERLDRRRKKIIERIKIVQIGTIT